MSEENVHFHFQLGIPHYTFTKNKNMEKVLTFTSISFSKKGGSRLALSLYVFFHNAYVCPHPQEEDVSVLKQFFSRIICTVMVWWSLGWFGVFHDGYANRTNSQMSLPRAIGRATDSRTVLPRAVG